MNSLAICDFGPGQYLLFGPNVGPLQYYSHLPIIGIALGLAFFVLIHDRKSLPNQILFGTTVTYALWVFFDSIIWATNRSDVIMFMWSLQVLIEPLVYIGCLYLLQVLIQGKDVSFLNKVVWALIYLPVIVTAPTALNLIGFDPANCLATEGPVALYYVYIVEGLVVLWTLVTAVQLYRKTKDPETRGVLVSLTIGIVLLLVSFSWGNIVGSFTDDWQLGQYGLFGLPVFTAFLAYTIVRFKTFDIRLLGSVALVLGLCALNISLLFVQQVQVVRIVAFVTFVISSILGVVLIRSIARDAERRERIERLAQQLEIANERQVNLIHFITHQIKGFVTKSRNVFAGILEGDYGPVPDTMRSLVQLGFESDTKGVATIQEILNASNIKSGKVTYTMQTFDLKALIEGIVKDLKPNAEAKKLELRSELGTEPLTITGDSAQLVNAYKNIIDNSIKYTPSGSVTVTLEKKEGKVLCTVTDTGVGITDEDKKNLFTEGGHGKESAKVNVDSTGFGLYIVKNIVEGHKGRVWAESDGSGKGSRFFIELPA